MTTTPKTPSKLGAPGRRLWRAVVDTYELRADELAVLEKACRTADDAARLDAALTDAPLMVLGSTGQQRANPLLHEARQTRALLASLLKQLGLPDEEQETPGKLSDNSKRAMKAAAARWGRQAAHYGA